MDFLLMAVLFGSGAVAGFLARASEIRRIKEEHRQECRSLQELIEAKNKSIAGLGGWLKRKRLV